MKKLIAAFALAAILVVPVTASAASGCTVKNNRVSRSGVTCTVTNTKTNTVSISNSNSVSISESVSVNTGNTVNVKGDAKNLKITSGKSSLNYFSTVSVGEVNVSF